LRNSHHFAPNDHRQPARSLRYDAQDLVQPRAATTVQSSVGSIDDASAPVDLTVGIELPPELAVMCLIKVAI
jgi:hypothetical protein